MRMPYFTTALIMDYNTFYSFILGLFILSAY